MKKRSVIVLLLSVVLVVGIFATSCSGKGVSGNSSDGSQSEEGLDGVSGNGSSGGSKKDVNDDSSHDANEGSGESASGKSELGELKSFEAKTLDGETFTQDDLAEKDVTVINFWSVGCGPCVAEMPEIAELAKELPDNVQIITLNFDGERGKAKTEQILEEAGFEGITLISGNGDLADVCMGIMYTPTTIFVDKDGNIVGEEIIGRQEDTKEAFLAGINATLRSMGEDEVK